MPRAASCCRARAPAAEASCSRNRAAATSWIFSSVSRSTPSLSSRPSASGTVIPNLCASSRTASWNPTFSCSSTNLKTLPPAWQPKQ